MTHGKQTASCASSGVDCSCDVRMRQPEIVHLKVESWQWVALNRIAVHLLTGLGTDWTVKGSIDRRSG